MPRPDPHSYADADQPRTRHLRLALRVDFARQVLSGRATLELAAPSAGPMDLDTRDLAIASIEAGGRSVPYALASADPILGSRLTLDLPKGTTEVVVTYETSPESPALQWLSPAQTDGKRHPFLFSQCQAIHARAVAPLQDTPGIRITYQAELTVPEPLHAVMSAGRGEVRANGDGTRTFTFAMPQAIPPYLIALAVGDLDGRDLSPRSRVFAEPGVVEAAAYEFAGIESMISGAEALFGPYEWDRFDLLVLPPSFPYGGMENPRMTFLTPTLLSGDRSLVSVVAHELAHSWTGNLVTNANAEHFWLNEGFTVWAERRIVEALYGAEEAALAWAIGQKGLDGALARFGADSPVTRLRTSLQGVDPDDVYSLVPYEKGSRFLTLLERTVGRERWDRFVGAYMSRFRFTSITSEEFLAFLAAELPGVAATVGAHAWVYEPGLPANAPVFRSEALEGLAVLAAAFSSGARPEAAAIASWSPLQKLAYLQRLPRELDAASCEWLDANLGLTASGNHEVLVEWLTIAGGSDHEPAFARIREVLTRVGRMKYVRPLYAALGRHPRTRALAREIFAAATEGYHHLSRRAAQSEMAKYPDGDAG